MRAWQFSKPKGPGFGISAGFFLTVLSSKPTLPALLQAVAPHGENGAVEGFGVPLGRGSSDKSLLAAPMTRGGYAIASKDRKTVLKMLVLSKEEAGFDPEPFAQSALAAQSPDELVHRVRATWTVMQIAFESHDPAVYPSVKFLLQGAQRLAELTDGVVADSISKRYALPENVFQSPPSNERLDARDVVAVTFEIRPDGIHLFTLGMQKFALPEFELYGIEDHAHAIGSRFLFGLAQATLLGSIPQLGGKVGAPDMAFELRPGGLDRGLWGETEVIELLPPIKYTAAEALLAWAQSVDISAGI